MEQVTRKKCKECGEVKSREEFFKRVATPDGLQYKCKDCAKLERREYRRKIAERRSRGELEILDTKKCPQCGKIKSTTEFNKNSHVKDGCATYCRACDKETRNLPRNKEKAKGKYLENREKNIENSKRWARENPEKAARISMKSQLKNRYGMSMELYENIFELQKGKCAICKGPPAGKGRFHVDHCHETEVIRGLLCHHCNLAIGNLKHDPIVVKSAAAYLESGQTYEPDTKTGV